MTLPLPRNSKDQSTQNPCHHGTPESYSINQLNELSRVKLVNLHTLPPVEWPRKSIEDILLRRPVQSE